MAFTTVRYSVTGTHWVVLLCTICETLTNTLWLVVDQCANSGFGTSVEVTWICVFMCEGEVRYYYWDEYRGVYIVKDLKLYHENSISYTTILL